MSSACILWYNYFMQQVIWDKVNLKSKKKMDKKPFNSLYGFLKGVKITEKDFRDAEKSLFPYGTK